MRIDDRKFGRFSILASSKDLNLQRNKINHLTLLHQAFVSGVSFCDSTGLGRLAGASGTQGRFAHRCDIAFCDSKGLERLAGASGT